MFKALKKIIKVDRDENKKFQCATDVYVQYIFSLFYNVITIKGLNDLRQPVKMKFVV